MKNEINSKNNVRHLISDYLDLSEIEYHYKPKPGQWLKFLRVLCGYEQKELAKKLDVEQATISKWENNLTKPGTQNIIALAEIFHIDLKTMFKLLGFEVKK